MPCLRSTCRRPRAHWARHHRRGGLKLLLDSCIWPGAKNELEGAGHEVEWVGDCSADPGDDQILAHAAQNGQVLATLDKDFGELAVALGAAHAGFIRLVDFRYLEQAPVCARVIAEHESDLTRGAIVTVERSRIRVRLPDVGGNAH